VVTSRDHDIVNKQGTGRRGRARPSARSMPRTFPCGRARRAGALPRDLSPDGAGLGEARIGIVMSIATVAGIAAGVAAVL
jgi:hypothetical protein